MNPYADLDGLSVFLVGLAGTGHCLGMCGPLVATFPGTHHRWQAHLYYHGGRLAVYTLAGAALGGLGGGLVRLSALTGDMTMIWMTSIQTMVSVLAAASLFLLGMIRLGLLREPRWMAKLAPHRLPGFGLAMQKALNRDGSRWLFVVGFILGLIPCGLSYAAFARALATQEVVAGAGLTLLFGIGTLPGLLILGTGVAALWHRFRAQTEIVAGLIMIGMAVSLAADIWTALY